MRCDRSTIFLASGALLLATFSEAQVHRTFVGVAGNDGNDCLTAATACRTINGAVGKVDTEGEVIIVSTGSYAGAVITKSVRINAPSGIVAFAALPITINVPSGTVSIRGLTIKAATPGSGIGIDVTNVGTLMLERMVVDGWLEGLRLGAAGTKTSISDSVFRNNSDNGIRFDAASNTSIVRSRFERNLRGFEITSGIGATVSVSRSSFTGNFNGFSAFSGFVAVDRCLLANNSNFGLFANSGAVVRLSNSSISGNGTGVSIPAGGVVETLFATGTIFTNGIGGNTINDVSGTLTPVALR